MAEQIDETTNVYREGLIKIAFEIGFLLPKDCTGKVTAMGWRKPKEASVVQGGGIPGLPLHVQLASGALQCGKNAAHSLGPLASAVGPFGVQFLVSSLAYSSGLAVFQCVGGCLRISCGTRILGPGFGCFAIGASCAFTGQVSRHTRRQLDAGVDLRTALYSLSHVMDDLKLSDALIDAVLGVAVFKALGGELRRVLPSDLRQPGAFGYNSVPTTSGEHTNAAQKAQLVAFFKRDGCHHCGSKVGSVIGDHIPPTKLVKDAAAAAKATSGGLQDLLAMAAQTLRLSEPLAAQHYFAQCTRCCKAQANLLRHPDKLARGLMSPRLWPRHLVSHALSQKAWPGNIPKTVPGVITGLRQYMSIAAVHAASTPRGGGGGFFGGRGGSRGHSKGGFAGFETEQRSGCSSTASSVARQSCMRRFWAPDGPGRALAAAQAAAAACCTGGGGGGDCSGGQCSAARPPSRVAQELFSLSQRLGGEEEEVNSGWCTADLRSPTTERGQPSGSGAAAAAAADYVFIHGDEAAAASSSNSHPHAASSGGSMSLHAGASDPLLQSLMQQARGSPARGYVGNNGSSSGMQQPLVSVRQGPVRQLFRQPLLAATAAAGPPTPGHVVQGYPAVPGLSYAHTQ